MCPVEVKTFKQKMEKIGVKIREIFKILMEEHNFLNLFWFNFHQVDKGVYRSAQLTPWRLRKIIKKYGIKTIINLRGNNKNLLYQKEREICEREGVNYYTIALKSRTPEKIKVEELERLIYLLQTAPKPLLFHCKAGADRTGFVAVLWHLLRGRDKNWAIEKELKLRYLYFPWSRAGKIKFLLEKYDGKTDFLEWFKENKEIATQFKSNFWGDFLNDKLFRKE